MNTQATKAIAAVIPMPYQRFDAHSGAYLLRAQASVLDPFVGIDLYTMPYAVFGPHPHAGMSAVSLMLPEAQGGFINRDSQGDHSFIAPGDLHWMQAGRGMIHDESPAEPGKAARGLQIFVNLARAHKQAEPVAFKVLDREMPRVPFAGASVRVVAGALGAARSPIADDARWLTQTHLYDVTIEPGASLALPVRTGDTAFFVLVSGTVVLPSGRAVSQSAIIFNRDDDAPVVTLAAGVESTVRGVFLSGAPMGEPVVAGGPFVGNSAQDIADYQRAFAQGRMGHLAP